MPLSAKKIYRMSVPSRSRPGGDHDRSRNRQHPYNNQSSSKNDRTQSCMIPVMKTSRNEPIF